MTKIQLWNRYNIAEYIMEHLPDYTESLFAIKEGIRALPRHKYRDLLRELEEDVDLSGYDISRTHEPSLTRMAALAALWEKIGTAKPDTGGTLKIEAPQEMVEAAEALIPFAYACHEKVEWLGKPFGDHMPEPPVEVSILSEEEVADLLFLHHSEFDSEVTGIFGMASTDRQAFLEYVRETGEKTGLTFSRTSGTDLILTARYSGRAAAVSIMTRSDDDRHRTTVESIEVIDAALEKLSKRVDVAEKSKKKQEISKF